MDRLNIFQKKYGNIIAIALIFTFAIVSPFFGGFDYIVAYRGDTLAKTYGHLTYSPYPIYWFIYPFAILPEKVGYMLWNVANAVCFILASRFWKNNLLSFSLFIGVFWTFYSGQIEGFLSGALVLMMLPNPWLAGLGIAFLTLKPQIGLFPIIFILLQRKEWRLLVVPALMYMLSFLTWGWWIPGWLDTLHYLGNLGPFAACSVSLYPYGSILLLLLWRYRSSLNIWMLVQSLILPYSPVYSLTPAVSIAAPPIWVNIIIWAFYLATEKFLALSSWGFIFPLAFLIVAILRIERPSYFSQSLQSTQI